ncbi:MAG: SDR family oxidoreductase [Gammaproteobacteria bacterium]|nr:SDR family oxidoreductase [Gammaproteobacteria bacterium]MYG11217.1 SDR family oxidoreductase [Gammaproteobacteria bacterium]MYK28032.1 SDR family oxidoreductase [Gammaproteobacteria bacterium]
MGKLKEKTSIIVGSATGIGATTARLMAAEGSRVVLADVNFEGAQQVASEIMQTGGEALPVRADIANEADVSQMVTQALDAFGGINVLVNNAAALGPDVIGRDSQADAASLELEVWDQTMAVNLRGYLLCMKYVIPEMLKLGGGSIVNTSSVSSLVAEPVRGAYAVSKAGVNQLSKHIATAYGKRGIRCNAVAPGCISTNPTTEKMYQAFTPLLLTPDLGSTEDVARVIVFLASDDAAYVNGQVIQVDGGMLSRFPLSVRALERQKDPKP